MTQPPQYPGNPHSSGAHDHQQPQGPGVNGYAGQGGGPGAPQGYGIPQQGQPAFYGPQGGPSRRRVPVGALIGGVVGLVVIVGLVVYFILGRSDSYEEGMRHLFEDSQTSKEFRAQGISESDLDDYLRCMVDGTKDVMSDDFIESVKDKRGPDMVASDLPNFLDADATCRRDVLGL